MTVVVSENRSAPVFGLCVLYRIGSRLEPRGRSGFAHLFEHLMFEGTPRAGKGVFDRVCEGSGGSNNGQTRPDVTLYVVDAPASALERILFLEADRMSGLSFGQESLDNQRDVVKEEILVNVRDDPYGLFEYGELPLALFEKWENAHDGYGDFHDLDAATLADVESFFAAFYRPDNAVLAVAGDVGAADVFALAERHFGPIPRGAACGRPDLSEPPRAEPVLLVREAPLARTPALAMGWRMPERVRPDAAPLMLLGELLHNGRASRLYRGLVEGREIATELSGGFNPFQGGVWYEGTTLFLSRVGFRREVPAESVLAAFDEEVARIARDGVEAAELARVKTKVLADTWAGLEPRLGLAIELAQATAIAGNPEALLDLPRLVEAVTSDDLRRAAEWLAPERRAAIAKVPPKGER
ncbi:MAG TPA: pitrilysin family protein [Thermoanaerobaculia bacterium]|nr:pitrilysin family protein [Thermoanaerobaculia bacterium]